MQGRTLAATVYVVTRTSLSTPYTKPHSRSTSMSNGNGSCQSQATRSHKPANTALCKTPSSLMGMRR